MKKYESVLKRVEQMEYKLGISYQKVDGRLYKVQRIINLIAVVYLFGINLLFILSALLNAANGNRIVNNQTLWLIAGGTAIEILSVVFSFTKFKIVGGVCGLLPLPYFVFIFAKLCEGYTSGWFGYTLNFYTRHLSSYVIILLASAIMLFIALRQRIRVNRDYKRILNNIYENYRNEAVNTGKEPTDEEWKEFIENYSPRTFKAE